MGGAGPHVPLVLLASSGVATTRTRLLMQVTARGGGAGDPLQRLPARPRHAAYIINLVAALETDGRPPRGYTSTCGVRVPPAPQL